MWIQPDVRAAIPRPRLPGHELPGYEGVIPVESKGGHVQVEDALADPIGIDGADHQDQIVAVTLAVRDDVVICAGMESEIAQPL